MIVHSVLPGETIYSIAERFGVSSDWLLINNQLEEQEPLAVGQSLVVLFPKETYTVMQGDDLASIADSHGVSLVQLLRNNPQLSNREYIYPGETLIISYTDEKSMEISTNGYAFPFIDTDTLRMTLPYLTYLTIFYYQITMEGDLVDIEEQELIDIAKGYGVASIMLISTLTDTGVSDIEVAHSLFASLEKQNRLIERVLGIMKVKGYYGLNVDIQDILEEDRQSYLEFLERISNRVKQEGYIMLTTVTPNTFQSKTASMYQGPEYAIIGQLSDSNMLLSYEWGYSFSPRLALPLNSVRALIEYATTQISPEQINIGLPTVGYFWALPFVEGKSVANAISYKAALELARDVGAEIQRDEASMAPFFTYTEEHEHVVWFRDAINIAALLGFVVEYNLEGIGTWNIMHFAAGIWMVINAMFDINKVI